MGIGTGFEVGESSQPDYNKMTRKELTHLALNLGMERKKVNKANKLHLAKNIKEEMRKW